MKLGIEEKLIDLRQERDRFEAECFRLRRQLKDTKERAHWVGALLAHSKKGMLCWTEAAQGLLPDGYDFATLVTFLDRVYCEHPVNNRILRKTTQGVAEWVQMTCSNCGAHQDVTEWEPPEHMHVCDALDCTVDGHSTHHCECGHTWQLIPLSAMPVLCACVPWETLVTNNCTAEWIGIDANKHRCWYPTECAGDDTHVCYCGIHVYQSVT